LGREAVKDGLETFELGAIHGKALLAPMLVKDDGRSFDVDRVLDSRKNKRLGLIGMRELVERVGGTFGVDSAPGVGTTLSAMIPLKHAGN
jgi:signal transduction histidine kinase